MKRVAIIAMGLMVAALAATVRCVPNNGGRAAEAVARDMPGFVIPVRGVRREQLRADWHDVRGGGARVHEGLDIPAPRLTPVVAAMAGRVEKLFQSRTGGLTLYIRSQEITAYYAHLAGYSRGLSEGQTVRAGQVIGFVGDTGNAGAGHHHLHFALARMKPGDRWWEGTPIDPYPLLAGRGGGR